VHEVGHASAAIAGELALPRPEGRPDDVRDAARRLDRAATRARATSTVRGTLAPRLRAVWTGAAATAAGSEADELGRRACEVVDALPAAARALLVYAAALEDAQRQVHSLQRQWDALDVDHALATVHTASLPDPTGVLRSARTRQADESRLTGRVRLSRAHQSTLDDLTAARELCARRLATITDATVPQRIPQNAASVRGVITSGLWFAEGAAAASRSRDLAADDAGLVRRILSTPPSGLGSAARSFTDADVAVVVERVHAHVDDPVYAQALVEEVGTDGLWRVLLEAGAPSSEVGPDTFRQLLGAFGSLVVTATQHTAPPGTDPRTRARLASGAALLADQLVSGATTTVSDSTGEHRAAGYWVLGQLLAAARAAGDTRPLPARLVRRAAAEAATAEIAETRDADARLRWGTTIAPNGDATFATWLDPADSGGDPLHALLREVGDDPAEQAALLAEPLPDSTTAAGALANARGDRLTLGEHLVRRWITHEANGIETHPDLRLETDDDLTRLLGSVSTAATTGAAETRARLMLEVSRTSAYAMHEASTTRIYGRGPGAVEEQVVVWLSAMHANVDRALSAPLFGPALGYTAETGSGPQPALDARELSGVVAALAVDTGMGLHARAPAAAYDRLVETEIARTGDSATAGADPTPGVVRLGFLDQAASAALTQVARRQDDLNQSAWQGLAEAGHVVDRIRRGGPVGLVSIAHTYAAGGTLRTAEEDLAIAAVRSDVELEQTELNELRRASLIARIEALVRRRHGVVASAFTEGSDRAPALPTAQELRQAREDEIRAAWDAVRDGRSTRRPAEGGQKGSTDHTVARIAEGRGDRLRELEQLPRGRQKHVRVVDSPEDVERLYSDLTSSGRRVAPPAGYDGAVVLREDGISVGHRTSRRFGPTVDIWFPDGDYRKVHVG
jgi:hypothetical protein